MTLSLFAQEKIQLSGGFQVKKGVIYQNNTTNSNSSVYKYETDAINTQYDLLVKYNLKGKTNLYSGFSIGYSSHTCVFNLDETPNMEDARFRSEVMSYKVPLRLGYFCTPKLELLVGFCYNLSTLNQQAAAGVSSSQNTISSEHTFSGSWDYFSTGSVQAGLQWHAGTHLSLFALCDLDLGKYPETRIASVVSIPNQPPQYYVNIYRPQLYMLSLGFSYKLFGMD